MNRDGTCVENYPVNVDVTIGRDTYPARQWRAKCGHGLDWRLGDTRAACSECVQGHCGHVKAGVAQGSLL